MQNRRQFIKNISVYSSLSTAALGLSFFTIGAMQGCSTMDEFLITDPSDLSEHVVIIGAGISGLYAAYQLKKRKIPYRIFEASHRFGGQISSDQGVEFGAFEFLNSDKNLLALVKDLNLKTEKIDSKSWVFKNGTSEFIQHLVDRVGGVLPNQQIRLNHRLLRVDQMSQQFKMTFATKKSDKVYSSRRLIIALPAPVISEIKGLQFEGLEMSLSSERTIRVVLQHKQLSLGNKLTSMKYRVVNKDNLTCTVRQLKDHTYITIVGDPEHEHFPKEIERISFWIAENIFDVPSASLNLKPENIFVWDTSWARSFKNKQLLQRKNQILVSDGLLGRSNQRIEDLFSAVNQQIDQFL
jgi:NAD(P)-binding Rossmann-like domain